MTGRNHSPHEAYDNRHGYLPGGSPSQEPMPRPMPLPRHPSVLEEELEIQHHEKLRLLGANRRLVADQIALQQVLDDAREELRRKKISISESKTRSRQLIEKGLKLKADLRATEHLKNEAAQLHTEIKRLNSTRHDLSWQIQILKKDLARLRADNKQLPALRAEREGLREELMHVRAAIDNEKKGGIKLMEQRQAMKKNLVSMASEVEKLRAQLTCTDVGPSGAGGPYGMEFGGSDCTKMNDDKHEDSAQGEIKQAIVDEESESQDTRRRKPPENEQGPNCPVPDCNEKIQGCSALPDSPTVKGGLTWKDEFVNERVDPKYRKHNGWLSSDDDSEEETYSALDVDKVSTEVTPKIDHNDPVSNDDVLVNKKGNKRHDVAHETVSMDEDVNLMNRVKRKRRDETDEEEIQNKE